MLTREDEKGRRYLFITNPDLHQDALDYVTVDGEYSKVIDLGIGSHCEVPLVSRVPISVQSRYHTTSEYADGATFITIQSPPGRTTFQMRLAPGEGTVLKLVK